MKFRDGPYWLKGGTDSPENLFAYLGFDEWEGIFRSEYPGTPVIPISLVGVEITPGEVIVPPIEVRVVVARDDGSRSDPVPLRTTAIVLEATVPNEARGLGLVPAMISPYVVNAMGERQARRYFVTAESFSALEAQRFGLVHEVVAGADLESISSTVMADIESLAAQRPRRDGQSAEELFEAD